MSESDIVKVKLHTAFVCFYACLTYGIYFAFRENSKLHEDILIVVNNRICKDVVREAYAVCCRCPEVSVLISEGRIHADRTTIIIDTVRTRLEVRRPALERVKSMIDSPSAPIDTLDTEHEHVKVILF